MNTNSNVYTVVYTTLVCVLVAVVLAFVSQKMKPLQVANEKAETVSQILDAAQFEAQPDNAAILNFYKENISEAILINAEGKKVAELNCAEAQVYSTSDLKAQNYNIKGEKEYQIPVYIFKNGISVIPVYGAGLWGPVWGYIALDGLDIVGAYFDHSGETPGLGGKIKDDPSFRAQLKGKKLDFNDATPFEIVKGGALAGKMNAIDAISGATMTCKGLGGAIAVWADAYRNYLNIKED